MKDFDAGQRGVLL